MRWARSVGEIDERVADARQALEKYYKYPDAEEFWVEINQSVQDACSCVR